MPAIGLQADYETQALSLIMEGYTHICDGNGDRFIKRCRNEETIVILHYDGAKRSWQRIIHRIIKVG